ncbi:MAG: indolepyruvate oxidoreductase subunit beta, partial [Eubacterium sp.]|nr:indolepyruvate oxidoreductase subunit beta [Eubacterium sp.]
MGKNIIMCGVGGQGTILASQLVATAAMNNDIPIKTAETIGMAQRGGSVLSHLRIGEGVNSPLIAKGEADLIIGFEPGETVRHLPFLKKGGAVVVSRKAVMPVSAMIGQSSYEPDEMIEYLKAHVEHLTVVDADRAAAELGS